MGGQVVDLDTCKQITGDRSETPNLTFKSRLALNFTNTDNHAVN